MTIMAEAAAAQDHRDTDGGVAPLPGPYLLFLGDADETTYLKTALGLRDWSPERCVGEWSCSGARATVGLTRMTPLEACAAGARSMVIGVSGIGGAIAERWVPNLVDALSSGLDLIAGTHELLADHPALREAALRHDRQLFDVRRPPAWLPIATGRKRAGRRLLTVGTDCALGKKYTALVLTRELRTRGLDVDFRATGQTGIMIAGAGVPIDAVPADFIAGAAELLSPDAATTHWDVIEGQGSLFHPSYAGVSLGLLHGAQPEVIVMCHEAGREGIVGLEGYALPDLEEAIGLTLELARLTSPAVRCAGIALNTCNLAEDVAAEEMARIATRLGLPVADPMRGGADLAALVDACIG